MQTFFAPPWIDTVACQAEIHLSPAQLTRSSMWSLLAVRRCVAIDCSALALSVAAQQKPVELAGAKAPPLLSRYAGSTLQNVSTEGFAAVRIPASAGRYGPDGKLVFDKSTTVEGKISACFYVQPKERSALELFRSYQSTLTQAGFATLYSCDGPATKP